MRLHIRLLRAGAHCLFLCLCALYAGGWVSAVVAQPARSDRAATLVGGIPVHRCRKWRSQLLGHPPSLEPGHHQRPPVNGGLYEFRPSDEVMRAQFAKMIVKSLKVPVSTSDECPFLDVEPMPGEDPLYPDKYVAAAAKWDIVRGFSAIRFGPWEPVNRAQIVTMVIRALHNWSGITLDEPTSDSDYYKEGIFAGFKDPFHGLNMQIAEYNGLLNSIWLDHDGRWDPWLPASRAEVAQILDNCLQFLD